MVANGKNSINFRQNSPYTISIKRLYDTMTELQMSTGKKFLYQISGTVILAIILAIYKTIIGEYIDTLWLVAIIVGQVLFGIIYFQKIAMVKEILIIDKVITTSVIDIESLSIEDIIDTIGRIRGCICGIQSYGEIYNIISIIYIVIYMAI